MQSISRSIRDGKHICQTLPSFSPLCNIRNREHLKSTQNNIASNTKISSARRHMASQIPLPTDWVKPVVVQPCRQPHKQTLIILHGRGDWATNFAFTLLRMPFRLPSSKQTGHADSLASSSGQTSAQSSQLHIQSTITLQDALPHTKFVFLTAPMRACTMMNGQENRQWFDNLSLVDPETRQDLQIEGLRETTGVISELVNEEIKDSKALGRNIQIGLMGFSQGAAASLTAGLVLSFAEDALVAVVSMSGWLPFRKLLSTRDAKTGNTTSGVDDFSGQIGRLYRLIRNDGNFQTVSSSDGSGNNTDDIATPSPKPTSDVSFLLQHGQGDDHVSSELSRMAAASLQNLGIADVVSKEYDGLGHFVNGQEIGDAVEFLRKRFDETEIVGKES